MLIIGYFLVNYKIFYILLLLIIISNIFLYFNKIIEGNDNCQYIDNNINNSIIDIYLMPYYYGFCKTNYSNTETNIKLCLNELQQSLNDVVEEYYIYGQPLDIDELITNIKETQTLKTWYKKGGNHSKKRNKNKTRKKFKY